MEEDRNQGCKSCSGIPLFPSSDCEVIFVLCALGFLIGRRVPITVLRSVYPEFFSHISKWTGWHRNFRRKPVYWVGSFVHRISDCMNLPPLKRSFYTGCSQNNIDNLKRKSRSIWSEGIRRATFADLPDVFAQGTKSVSPFGLDQRRTSPKTSKCQKNVTIVFAEENQNSLLI